ncbi:unnamed protein product [Urochloa humidicola]
MPCEGSRARAMALVARADGVISMEIAGGGRDKLEVVGNGVDAVSLVSCLRRKLGHAEILQVEVVKDTDTTKEPDDTTPEPPEPVEPPPQCYLGYCYFQHHPPPVVACEEPGNCLIM